MVRSIPPAKLGVDRDGHLEGKSVSRSQSISENYACDESALDPLSVLDGDVAPVDQRLLLHVSLCVGGGATPEQ